MPKNIADFSKEELKDFIDSIDVVLTDCDGELLRYFNVFKNVKILNFKNSLNFNKEKIIQKVDINLKRWDKLDIARGIEGTKRRKWCEILVRK